MYHNPVKNITVSVDDEIYHRARVKAAERRTSVSALVRKALEALAEAESDFDRLRRLEKETLQNIRRRLSGLKLEHGDTRNLKRDQLHDREMFR